jgi:hypothetical protein
VLVGVSMGLGDFGETVHRISQEQVKHLIFNFNLIT